MWPWAYVLIWQFSCMAVNFFDNFPVWPWPFVNIQIIVWQFSCIAMSLHINLTIFLYGCEAFWQFSSMAVSTIINFFHFWLSAWPADRNFSCQNHFRSFWQFSCMALNFFDNFTVWPWPFKFIRKSLTIFLCGFLTIFLPGFLTIFLSGFLTIFRFPYSEILLVKDF